MRILGIDYGKRKIGLAIAVAPLAEPLVVIKYTDPQEAIEKILEQVRKNQIEGIVIGVSEGQMEEETRRFGKALEEKVGIKPVLWDETLTSKDAQKLSIEAGQKRSKRKGMEDAFAACLVLQSYLDRYV